MKAPTIEVQPFKNPSGDIVYRVYGWEPERDGDRKMVRKNFRTVQQAEDFAQRLRNQWNNVVSLVELKYTSLTDDELREAESVSQRLKGKASLTDAIDFYLANYQAPKVDRLLSEAFKEFIEEKRTKNLRPRSISNLQTRVGFLVKCAAGLSVSELTESKVCAVIHREGKGRGAETKNNDRRALGNFFNWCVRKRYCAANPVDGIDEIEMDEKDPEVFTLNQVDAILSAARSYMNGAMLPYFVLGLFAGMRPKEIQRIDWGRIDLVAKHVKLKAEWAKNRQRRIIELSDNAIEWLRPSAIAQTPIWPANGRKMFEAVKKQAGFGSSKKSVDELKPLGLIPWVQDGMRHTALSCHFAQHGHEGETARWAGNSPDEMHASYKDLVSKAEAAKFWAIYPDDDRVEEVDFCKSDCKSEEKTA